MFKTKKVRRDKANFGRRTNHEREVSLTQRHFALFLNHSEIIVMLLLEFGVN